MGTAASRCNTMWSEKILADCKAASSDEVAAKLAAGRLENAASGASAHLNEMLAALTSSKEGALEAKEVELRDAMAQRGRRGRRRSAAGGKKEGGSPAMGRRSSIMTRTGEPTTPRGVRMARDLKEGWESAKEAVALAVEPLLPFDPLRALDERTRALVPKAHEAPFPSCRFFFSTFCWLIAPSCARR